MEEPVIQGENLTKVYRMGEVDVQALRGVSLEVKPGEVISIMGPSGSGKSTLMNILGCLDRPTTGEYRLGGRLVSDLSDDDLAVIRNQRVGFVFQTFNLLGRQSAVTNVELPMRYAGVGNGRRKRAIEALEAVGLADRLHHRPNELSGGQQQRVAIARALVQRARIILADEPIASLDPESARNVMEILARINREQGITVLVSLHQVQFARRYCPRTVALRRGEVVYDGPSAALEAGMLRTLYGAAVEEMLDGTETIDAVMNDPVVAEALAPVAASI
jgi:putative ABC transport system ATP-binding protein